MAAYGYGARFHDGRVINTTNRVITLAGVAVAYVPWIPSFAKDTEGTPLLAGPCVGSVTPSVVAKALARWGAGDPIV